MPNALSSTNPNAFALTDSDLPAALADVVEALQQSMGARVDQLQMRMVTRAGGLAFDLAIWGFGIAAALVAWACANVALGLWLGSLYGEVAATLIAALIHASAAAALLFVGFTRSRGAPA